ncbi:MAG: DUF5654 family protein [Nanoarchaeota archaeon]|nr:DUF5654 family protein [Nanoarchaeota archaeon]
MALDHLSPQEKQEVKQEVKKEVDKQLSRVQAVKIPLRIFHSEFKKQTATAIIAAFGFLIALVWKDIIVNLVSKLVHADFLARYPLFAPILSAVIVTLVCVTGILLINKWANNS